MLAAIAECYPRVISSSYCISDHCLGRAYSRRGRRLCNMLIDIWDFESVCTLKTSSGEPTLPHRLILQSLQ